MAPRPALCKVPPPPAGEGQNQTSLSAEKQAGHSPLDPTVDRRLFCSMGFSLFRRLIVVLSVLALLLAGLATTSVAADAPCGMEMAAAAADGDSCDGGSMPDNPETVPDASVCSAKCPVLLLDWAVAPPAVAYLEFTVQAPRRHSVQAGIGIVPPFEPPRA
ncbi:hypothetical protein [Falsiroseomonas tokyonensis]|uniref:hypothetical protein n=1 Tax=Falsiroseomonas tokyonensis TaxID=430521 RepID=UPI001C2094F6|nr:hypothetical protein [Falsiroseomonas tokyonensis]